MGSSSTWFEYLQSDSADAAEMSLHASIPANEDDVLPLLLDGIDRACGWVLHRSRIGRAVMQIRLEVQGRHLMELYAALVSTGLEFSRDSQLLLNDRCTCVKHNADARKAIQPLRLDVLFDEASANAADWTRRAANA